MYGFIDVMGFCLGDLSDECWFDDELGFIVLVEKFFFCFENVIDFLFCVCFVGVRLFIIFLS